jgi:hypothetical protein
MSGTDKVVTTVDSLIAATKTEGIKAIILGADLDGVCRPLLCRRDKCCAARLARLA